MRRPLPRRCVFVAVVTSFLSAAVAKASAVGNPGHQGSGPVSGNHAPSPPPSPLPSTEEQMLAGAVDKRAWKDLQGPWGKRGWQDMGSGWGKRGWQDMGSGWGKRGWQDMGSGWGKRGWQDMGSGWGKRGWQDMGSGWGKRGWQDMGSGWGKRGWQDMGSGWGKRGWQDMGSGWGKRGWQDMGSGWGKRGWQDMGSGWGKRAWKDMQSGWGKRAWENLQGSWGKRDALSALLAQGMLPESSQDYLNDEALRSESEALAADDAPVGVPPTSNAGPSSATSSNSNGGNSPSLALGLGLGAYAAHMSPYSDAENPDFDDHVPIKRALADWSNFRGSWGKRVPAWHHLKGLWGKRSSGLASVPDWENLMTKTTGPAELEGNDDGADADADYEEALQFDDSAALKAPDYPSLGLDCRKTIGHGKYYGAVYEP